MTEKCDKYRRRSYEGLEKLTREVRALTKPILGKRGFSGADILENWADIVGGELAVGVVPEKLAFPPGARVNGTLHVKSVGGAFALLFEHNKERVMQRINTYFGYPAVSRVKITQGAFKLETPPPAPPRRALSAAEKEEICQKAAAIPDETLRRQVMEIGAALYQKKKNNH